jgi:hypothetical protein
MHGVAFAELNVTKTLLGKTYQKVHCEKACRRGYSGGADVEHCAVHSSIIFGAAFLLDHRIQWCAWRMPCLGHAICQQQQARGTSSILHICIHAPRYYKVDGRRNFGMNTL